MAKQHELIKIYALGLAVVLCMSCRHEEVKHKDSPQYTQSAPPQEKENEVHPYHIYSPYLENVPCSFHLRADQLPAFTKFFTDFSYSDWFTFDLEKLDTIVRIDVRINATYSFIDSFHYKTYYRRNCDYRSVPFTLPAIHNVDTLSALHIPMVTKAACRKLFKEPDSMYLFYSFVPETDPYAAVKNRIYQHIFYNHHKASFVWMSLDTAQRIIDSMTLFSIADTTTSFVLRFPMPSVVQVIKHTTTRKPSFSYREEQAEVMRYFISSDGQISDWTKPSIDIEKFCFPLPQDSILGIDLHDELLMKAAPLPLHHEIKVKKLVSDFYNEHSMEIMMGFGNSIELYYLAYRIEFTNGSKGIVLGSRDNWVLALQDNLGNFTDARPLSNIECMNWETRWTTTNGHLASDHQLYIIDAYRITDTMDVWTVEKNKIMSIKKKQPLLTIPYGDLAQYFPFKEQRVFSSDLFSRGYTETVSFPDSVSACLDEVMGLNGEKLFGINYSITHASNGLSYWTFLQDRGISSSLKMKILDQNNVFRRGEFELASGGGDEGDYWMSEGYFLNDSTYLQISKTCAHEKMCDSTVTIFRITSNGKIFIDPTFSESYRFPYR